jgi:hypothetical protein
MENSILKSLRTIHFTISMNTDQAGRLAGSGFDGSVKSASPCSWRSELGHSVFANERLPLASAVRVMRPSLTGIRWDRHWRIDPGRMIESAVDHRADRLLVYWNGNWKGHATIRYAQNDVDEGSAPNSAENQSGIIGCQPRRSKSTGFRTVQSDNVRAISFTTNGCRLTSSVEHESRTDIDRSELN